MEINSAAMARGIEDISWAPLRQYWARPGDACIVGAGLAPAKDGAAAGENGPAAARFGIYQSISARSTTSNGLGALAGVFGAVPGMISKSGVNGTRIERN